MTIGTEFHSSRLNVINGNSLLWVLTSINANFIFPVFEIEMSLRCAEREARGPGATWVQVVWRHSHDAVAEIALEGLGLVSLHLAVLHGAAPERRVQLGHVHGCGPLLVLRGILAKPVVQIHSWATGSPFGLQEVGRTSPGEGTAWFCVGEPQSLSPLLPFSWARGERTQVLPGSSAWSSPYSAEQFVGFINWTERCFCQIFFCNSYYQGKLSSCAINAFSLSYYCVFWY